MPETENTTAVDDFSSLMSELTVEAGKKLANHAPVHETPGQASAATGFADILRPIVSSITGLSRAIGANSEALARLEAKAERQEIVPEALNLIHTGLEDKKSVSTKLFDAMHEELRSYKDAFLFEAMQKPIARDLITLFDDLIAMHLHMDRFLSKQHAIGELPESGQAMLLELQRVATQLDHSTHTVMEIMSRLEVEKLDPGAGKHDRTRQKAMLVEPAEEPEQDGDIVRSMRPAFAWRGRIIRPEEVVIRRYKSPHAPESSAETNNGSSPAHAEAVLEKENLPPESAA